MKVEQLKAELVVFKGLMSNVSVAWSLLASRASPAPAWAQPRGCLRPGSRPF